MDEIKWRGNVAILGNGPSAAYAYRACVDNGIMPHVYASSKPSFPNGAFWLHWMPPTIPEELLKKHQSHAVLTSIGSADMYSGKMWGETFETSFPLITRIEVAYAPEALELLWGGFQYFEPSGILHDAGVVNFASQHDLVLQTFPTDASKKLQPPKVFFPVLSRYMPEHNEYALCVYNGTHDEWVRMTFGFGFMHVEFPAEAIPNPSHWPGHTWRTFKYPDMHPRTKSFTTPPASNVVLLGRHARWDRRLLSHSAYQETLMALNRMERQDGTADSGLA
jgi:hypothetical protein